MWSIAVARSRTATTTPYGNSLNKNETVSNPWQYASGYYDATTGLYKFGTRYYDPQLGRWTQKDPKPSANPYLYTNDDPINEVDPSGRAGCVNALITAAVAVYGAADFGSIVATAAATAIAGPLGFLLGLAVVAIAVYAELLSVNMAFDACGLSQYDFPLPKQ